MEKEKELVPKEMQEIINPDRVIQAATIASKKLKDIVDKKPKKVIINGEKYLEYEDWQTLARFYGISVRTHDAIPFEVEGIKGAKAQANVISIKTGNIIGGAESFCMRDEKNWTDKPFFQLASMAQTRAGAKALRNVLSWVVVLAGYKGTPAEEMVRDNFNNSMSTPKQRDLIQSLMGKLKWDDTKGKDYLKRHFKVETSENLTKEQASAVITGLQGELRK